MFLLFRPLSSFKYCSNLSSMYLLIVLKLKKPVLRKTTDWFWLTSSREYILVKKRNWMKIFGLDAAFCTTTRVNMWIFTLILLQSRKLDQHLLGLFSENYSENNRCTWTLWENLWSINTRVLYPWSNSKVYNTTALKRTSQCCPACRQIPEYPLRSVSAWQLFLQWAQI